MTELIGRLLKNGIFKNQLSLIFSVENDIGFTKNCECGKLISIYTPFYINKTNVKRSVYFMQKRDES